MVVPIMVLLFLRGKSDEITNIPLKNGVFSKGLLTKKKYHVGVNMVLLNSVIQGIISYRPRSSVWSSCLSSGGDMPSGLFVLSWRYMQRSNRLNLPEIQN